MPNGCKANERCNPTEKYCELRKPGTCESDLQCKAQERCFAPGVCKPAPTDCKGDKDCPFSKPKCAFSSGPRSCVICTVNADCPGALECRDKRCQNQIDGCTSDADCPDNTQCNPTNKQCHAPTRRKRTLNRISIENLRNKSTFFEESRGTKTQ